MESKMRSSEIYPREDAEGNKENGEKMTDHFLEMKKHNENLH